MTVRRFLFSAFCSLSIPREPARLPLSFCPHYGRASPHPKGPQSRKKPSSLAVREGTAKQQDGCETEQRDREVAGQDGREENQQERSTTRKSCSEAERQQGSSAARRNNSGRRAKTAKPRKESGPPAVRRPQSTRSLQSNCLLGGVPDNLLCHFLSISTPTSLRRRPYLIRYCSDHAIAQGNALNSSYLRLAGQPPPNPLSAAALQISYHSFAPPGKSGHRAVGNKSGISPQILENFYKNRI